MHKKWMQKKTMRAWLRLCLCLCLALGMTGCGTKLADGFEKETIIQTGEQIVTELHTNDTAEVLKKYMREDYLEQYPVDSMKEMLLELRSGCGNFISYTMESVVGKTDETVNNGNPVAVILITAAYEKGEINYTLTFDQQMKLIGLHAAG